MSDMDDDGDDPNHEKLGAHSAAHFLGAGDSQFVNDWFGVVDKRTDNTGAVDPDYAPSEATFDSDDDDFVDDQRKKPVKANGRARGGGGGGKKSAGGIRLSPSKVKAPQRSRQRTEVFGYNLAARKEPVMVTSCPAPFEFTVANCMNHYNNILSAPGGHALRDGPSGKFPDHVGCRLIREKCWHIDVKCSVKKCPHKARFIRGGVKHTREILAAVAAVAAIGAAEDTSSASSGDDDADGSSKKTEPRAAAALFAAAGGSVPTAPMGEDDDDANDTTTHGVLGGDGGAGDGGASDSGRVAVAAMEVGMSVAVRVTSAAGGSARPLRHVLDSPNASPTSR